MDPDAVVVRHAVAGVPKQIADVLAAPVINAGDGAHEHPTQALLDLLTVKLEKGCIDGLTVTIVGDILNSRVARSNIYAFRKMGAEVRVAGPPQMIPAAIETLGVKAFTSLREAIDGVDIVMALRIQNERLSGTYLPSIREYSATYGIDREKLKFAKDDAIVMHPGPVNRGVELSHDLTDHRPSVILDQVRNGVAIRMAVLYLLSGRRQERDLETRSGKWRRKVSEQRIWIRGGRVLDPATERDEPGDLLIEGGVIAAIGAQLDATRRGSDRCHGCLDRPGLRRSPHPPARARPGVQGRHRFGGAIGRGRWVCGGRLHGEHPARERRPLDDGLHHRPRQAGLTRARLPRSGGDSWPRRHRR